MDIILHNIKQSQLPLIQELAKVLGIEYQQSGVTYPDTAYESYVSELDERTREYEQGTARLLSLEELENNARKAYGKKEK